MTATMTPAPPEFVLGSATATTFINEQIKAYEAKLEEAETRLKEFRLRNIGNSVGDGKDAAARIADLSSQLERARLEYHPELAGSPYEIQLGLLGDQALRERGLLK